MSLISIASGEPTCTVEELHAAAKANNFQIEPGSQNETSYLLLNNSFDAICKIVASLPDYEHPDTKPVEVEGGERKFYHPTPEENPLNAWMFKSHLRAKDEGMRNGVLKGKTVAVKDNMSVAGFPIGLGTSESLFKGGKHPISPIDATVVRRVLEAGGTIAGTATCENLSFFAVSYTSDAGVVHNPWLPGYATGGSSSGCGALLSVSDVEAARKSGKDSRTYPLGEGVDLALGGDQGGSIRLPAAYSGFYGLKPSYGLVPYTGIASLTPLIDHVGPMARTVEDVALLLGALAGYDGMDPRMTAACPLRSQVPDYAGSLESWIAEKQKNNEWNSSQAGKGLKIGILQESFHMIKLDDSVASTLESAIERFRAIGAEVKEVSIPFHKHGPALWNVAVRPLIPYFSESRVPSQLAHTMPHIDPIRMGQENYDRLANRNPAPINVALNVQLMEEKYGPALARKAYMHAFQLRAAYDEALKDFDVLVTPMTPSVGPKIPNSAYKTPENPQGRSERIMDLFEPVLGNTMNTAPFNLSGHPAMSMPVGWAKVRIGEGKLPVGMQLVAKKWDEGSLFKAAKAWEMGGKRWMDL